MVILLLVKNLFMPLMNSKCRQFGLSWTWLMVLKMVGKWDYFDNIEVVMLTKLWHRKYIGSSKIMFCKRDYLDLGLFALHSKARNMISYSAGKNWLFCLFCSYNMIWKTFNPIVESGMYWIVKRGKKMLKCIIKYWKNRLNMAKFSDLNCHFVQSF